MPPQNHDKFFLNHNLSINLDKQQEVDVQTFDNQPGSASSSQRTRSPRTMTQITGFKRPLMHTNSFTSDRLPVYGVETVHEATLGAMLNDVNTWGIDIFKIGSLSCNRPLTCVAYQIFQVWINTLTCACVSAHETFTKIVITFSRKLKIDKKCEEKRGSLDTWDYFRHINAV